MEPMPRHWVRLAGIVALAAVSGAAQSPVTALPTPAGPESGMYSFATGADGQTYSSWIEPVAAGGHALRFSRLERGRWTEPRDIARGGDWFVNWADHPSLTAAPDGRLFAHWLVNTGKGEGGEYRLRDPRRDLRGRRAHLDHGLRGGTAQRQGLLGILDVPADLGRRRRRLPDPAGA